MRDSVPATDGASAPQSRGAPERQRLVGPLTVAVAALLVACFMPYLRWMWEIWWRSPYYGHGPLIPLVSAWLVYSRRRDLVRTPDDGRGLWGVPVVILGLGLYALAVYWDVNFPQGFAMIMVLAGLVVLLFGWERARVVAFPVAYLAFMVPVDRLLVTQFSNPLQLISATLAAGFPRLVGLPVVLHGTSIAIPDYTFEVAQACSGLKSIIAMGALSALFAYLVVAPMWKRIVLVVASVPVALAANVVRITATLMLGRVFSPAVAEGFFHNFSGLLVFAVALLGLFAIARGLRCDQLRGDIW